MRVMQDKELLELAAKAYGFGDPQEGRVCWTESEYPNRSGKNGALWNYVGYMDTAELWNPLTDDGDAMRMAVRLRIDCEYEGDNIVTWFVAPRPGWDNGQVWSWSEPLGDDPDAATRRAIVRAAAEIGLLTPNAKVSGAGTASAGLPG